jgi:hypothetical protein
MWTRRELLINEIERTKRLRNRIAPKTEKTSLNRKLKSLRDQLKTFNAERQQERKDENV